MPTCLIIAALGKKGHARQALAIAARLGLTPTMVEVSDGDPPPELPTDAVLVLAAGREAIAPARAIARRRPRPPVAVLQPVRQPRDFDLVWAPRHDRGLFTRDRRRLETLTAPSAVTADDRAAGAAWLAPRLPPGPVVGVLVGGPSRSHRFGVEEAREFAARLVAFARTHDVALAVTTSRRTGPAATAALAERLAGEHLLVDGTTGDASLAYAGIIERATTFVVTSDSVAMLSDVAATGKPFYAWRLPGGRAKFERLYAGLARHGALRWFDGRLDRWSYPPLDAAGEIADTLRKRLPLSHAAPQHK